MKISVKVKPNARENSVKQMDDGSLEVRVSVPPEKGKANERVIKLLAKHYKVPPSKVSIIKGETSKEKVVEIYS